MGSSKRGIVFRLVALSCALLAFIFYVLGDFVAKVGEIQPAHIFETDIVWTFLIFTVTMIGVGVRIGMDIKNLM